MTKRFWTLGLSALLCAVLVGSVLALDVNGVTRGGVASSFQLIETPRYENSYSIPSGIMVWSHDGSDFWYTDCPDSASYGTVQKIPGYMLLPVSSHIRDNAGWWFVKIAVNCATDSVSYAWTNQ